MRMNVVYAIGFVVAALPVLSAAAMAAEPMEVAHASPSQVVQTAEQCPPGTYWEPAGYVGSGKWRDAHCAADNGRQ